MIDCQVFVDSGITNPNSKNHSAQKASDNNQKFALDFNYQLLFLKIKLRSIHRKR